MDKTLRRALGLMLVLVFAFWLPVGPVRAAGSVPEARMTATVVEFQVRGGLDEQAGAIIADLMMSAIANTGRFILRDRLPLSAAAKIAKASELGETGLLDPKTAAELGRLYGLDAVVTGGVYKLGDLITVTARLIDTRNASLLRSGQIQGKDIDTIQIKVNELAAMITAPPDVPKTYALTVKTEPADASVRLPNSPKPYQPGIQLVPGEHEIEVARPGYVARQEKLRIGDRDVTVTLALEKARYGLTVRPDPADAQVRLLNSPVAYQPGVALAPGDYEVEVAREGYVARKFAVRIVDDEVAVPVTLEKTPPPPPPAQYRLTVQANPPQAFVRLLDRDTPYQPGMRLPPGDYRIEVALDGYESSRIPVRIADGDVTVPVKLTRKSKEPAKMVSYRLTVRADPANARVRLLNIKTAYQPGVALAPGTYTVEVSQSGYETKRIPVQVADSDVTVPVALVKESKPEQYRLTVRTDPSNARVRLLGTKTSYNPGVSLAPGTYTVEVSQSGYESQRTTARIVDGDVTIAVALVKQPEPSQYRLTVRADPPDARVRLVNSSFTYRPGVPLPPGDYVVEVTGRGYESKRVPVRISDGDASVPVELERSAAAAAAPTPPAPTRAGEWRISAVHADNSLDGPDRSEVMRVFSGYVGRAVTRDTLLDGALRFYQSTGITLGFVVRASASGTADLYARATRRVRRTYESNIPIMTRSQLENSGFSVSVQ